MFFKTNKLNEFRFWGLVLLMLGMLIMIVGTAGILLWGEKGQIFTVIFMIVGILFMAGSMAVYFWAGMMSTSTISLQCPECGKMTKLVGKTDRCYHCKTILTLDPSLANTAASADEGDSNDK
ncbi:MAG TPA: DUF2614 family zinc ribbon-containing protein [Bacilli bacterium]